MLLTALFAATFGVWMIANGEASTDRDFKALYFVFGAIFSLVPPLFALEILRYRILISRDGLVQWGMMRVRPLKIVWADVKLVDYAAYSEGQYFVETVDGRRMRVDGRLEGFKYFVQSCVRWLSPEIYGPAFENKQASRARNDV